MASRGPGGTEGLTDVVAGSIGVLLLMLTGLTVWLYTTDQGADADATPSVASATPTAAAAADVDGDGDGPRDGEQPAAAGSGSGSTSGSGGAANRSPRPDAPEPTPPARTARNTGLFSPDDPDRTPAIAVPANPRGELVRRGDLDGDGREEQVWAAIVGDRVRIRLERVVDGVWTAPRTHEGALADRLVRLKVEDLNDDGQREVYTVQWVASEGESATLWTISDDDLAPMTVRGGCWNGGNTLGIVGTLVRVPETPSPTLAAICPEEGEPRQRWPSALYRWDDGHWTFDTTRER